MDPGNDDRARTNPANLPEITALTAETIGVYVGRHTVALNDLPDLITTVGKELARLGQALAAPEEEKPTPAAPINRSVTPDHIICLEDGKKLKMQKPLPKTYYGLTPDEYRSERRLPYGGVELCGVAQRSVQEDRPRKKAGARSQVGESTA